MEINYEKCPNCGSVNSIKFVYGLPTYELFLEAEAGKVKLGGCCVTEGNPEYYCKDCMYEWNKQQAIVNTYKKIKEINVSVGGIFDGFYQVTIDIENLELTWEHSFRDLLGIQKPIRAQTAANFVEQLKRVHLLDWKSEYFNSKVLDGTEWNVEIKTDENTISKAGNNYFPEEWEMFCKLLENMSGKRIF